MPPGMGGMPGMGGAPQQVNLAWARVVDVPPDQRAALLVALGALSDRMVAVIREKEGLAYRLGAGVRCLPDGRWLVTASVGTRPQNRDRVVQLFGEIATALGHDLPNADDLARMAARVRERDMLARLSAGARAARLARLTFEGPTSPLAVTDEQQRAATPAAVREAAATLLAPGDLTLVETR